MNFSLNLPTWFPLAPKVQAGMADAPDETDASPRSAGLGPITGRDLSDLGSLVKPFVRDPFNRLRPPFSREAAELSLELASMAYTLDLEPWTEAGGTIFPSRSTMTWAERPDPQEQHGRRAHGAR